MSEGKEPEEELVDLTAEIENSHEGKEIEVNEGNPQPEPQAQEEAEEEPLKLPEDDQRVPEKFRGKPIDEVIRSYRELESELGRKNNELGQLRKETDQELLQKLQNLQNEQPAQKQEEELSDDEFFENPREAVNKALEQSEIKKQIDELTTTLKEQSVEKKKSEFENKHPDYLDVVQDPNFQNWVQESNVRLQMFQEADQNYDFDKANELLDTYKALKGGSQQDNSQSEGLTDEDIAATQEAGLERGNSQKATKKVYSARQIIELKKNNPKKYKQMLPEIKQAYQDGRVKR